MSGQVGQTIGTSKLERLLGRGFLGETYLARQAANGRQVVVKIFHEQYSGGPDFRSRFTAILERAAAVRDPQIVGIEDYGEAFGRYYVTLPFFPDGSLRGLLQRYQTDLPVARAVAITRQAAAALTAAHASGLIHRDLKPENILLTKRPGTAGFAGAKAQVADFGLTQLAESGVTIGGNVAFGSYPYISPEHCTGTGLTPASDVYSLGIILYEMVAGGPPFQVKTLGDALTKHLSGTVPKPGTVVANLPAGLEAVVLKCLEKDAAARYQTAQEVGAALAALRVPGEIEVNVDTPKVDTGAPSIVVKVKGHESAVVPPPADPPGTPKKWVIKLGENPGAEPVATPQVPVQPVAPPPIPMAPVPNVGETIVGPIDGPPPPPPSGPGRRWEVRMDAPPQGSGGGESTGLHAPGDSRDQPGGLGDSFVAPSQPASAPPPKRKLRSGKSSRAVTVVLEPTTLTLIPGQPGVVRVTIANTGRQVEHFTLRVDGLNGPGGNPASWVELPRDRIQLIPEGRATVPIKIVVPRTADSAAGEYEIEIAAVGAVSQEVGTAVMSWIVQPFFETDVTVTPARAGGWRRARYAVQVANRGNAIVRCGLTASDDEHALRYQFSQPEVTLDHGVHASIDLDVRGRLRPMGSVENRNCSIRVDRLDSGAGPDTKTARAQFTHRAVVPTWLLPVGLALGLAVYGLWPRTNLAIEVTPPNLSATVDFRSRVIGVVRNQKGEAIPDRQIRWSVQDSNIVQVAGIVGDTVTLLPRRVGTTTLTATTSRALAVNVPISVSIAAVETISLAPNALSLAIGETRRLTAAIVDAGGKRVERDPTWFSSDQSVATVGNGEVTAKAAGRAVISAQVETKTATANIVVRPDSVGGAAIALTEDCLPYEPSLLVLKKDNPNGWMVQHQGRALVRLDEKGDGERALNLARRYKQHCYIGRRNTQADSTAYYIEYWKGRSDIRSEIKKEDCRSYNPADLQVVNAGSDWELRSAGAAIVRAASKVDADKARDVAAAHVAFCQIGVKNKRPNHRLFVVQYWK